MKKLKSPLSMKFLRGACLSALASTVLFGGSAFAQKEPPPGEEPVYEEVILEEGRGWQLKYTKGTALDDKSQTYKPYEAKIFTVRPEGILEAPLAGNVKEELLADGQDGDTETVFSLNQAILEEIDISRQQGYLTPALEAIAQPDEGGLLAGCPDQIHTRSKSLSFNTPLNYSGTIGGGFSGSLSATGNMQGSATGLVEFAVKRTKVLWACIPYSARFNYARAYGSASVSYGANISGNLSYNYSWQQQIAKPSLGSLSFFIGPVPVYIGFNLPIDLGLDVQASVTGSLTYNGSQAATGNFDYTCRLSGCTGGANYNLGSNTQNTLSGNVSGRVYPNIWVQAAVRAYLYTEWVAYAQVGVRPYLRGDLWGYAGNTCGDADGNGINETVSALTFDLDWQLYITGQARAFGSTPTQWNNLWSTPRNHIRFWDLLGSSALSPMISGSATAPVNVSRSYSTMMRPCWPYNEQVSYRFNWGDATTTNLTGASHSWNASSHTWTSTGAKSLSSTALSDTHGRGLNRATTRTVQVQ